jgi:ATP synthase F1 complex assembly factor 2
MSYFDTDATCYHETFPENLAKLQEMHWKPIIMWTEKHFDVKINTTTDIFAVPQPEETKQKIRKVVEGLDAMELAAFERAVMSSKSFLIGLALIHRAVSVEEAAQAAHVEVNAQIDRWGEVEDSKLLLKKRKSILFIYHHDLGHDVEREHIRQTLGSVAIALMHKR